MTHWLIEPFASDMVLRALVAGVIAACLCSVVGCWVVLRGNVFLGEAMTHGILPGVALAALFGVSMMAGGLVAALAMAVGVAAIGRSSKLPSDTGTGMLLVGMLALGVIVVSRSQSFAVDLTGYLFGDVFAVGTGDLVVLAGALAATLGVVLVGHRAFVAVTFDPRKASTLGLRPQLAVPALTVLMAVALVASFHVVGTLLVLGLLVAPPATALAWSRSIPRVMGLSALIGSAAVYLGLLISWYAGTAGGASIAGVAVLLFFASAVLSALRTRRRRASVLAASACLAAAGCAAAPVPVENAGAAGGHDEVEVAGGARELDGPLTRLVLVDPATGDTSVYDAVDETETPVGSFGPAGAIAGDGRFAYVRNGARTTVVDAGAWTFDHGDHYHYFATEPGEVATLEVPLRSVAASNSLLVVQSSGGAVELVDREKLGDGTVEEPSGLAPPADTAAVAPYGGRLVTVGRDGRMQVRDATDAADLDGRCPQPTWAMPTRRAVVFGCATGAVRVTGGDGDLTVTPVPFPPDAPAPAPASMTHRDRADVFAGVSAGAVWVLDTRQRTWTMLPVPDAVAANTAGDGSVLVLHRDGTLGAFDVRTRSETARVPLLSGGVRTDGPAPVVEIDSDRAYVNNAATREVYEIDYADGLRLARTLRTEVMPGLMVEAGR
ncbi:ABC-type Mn2+/Zn2+ transport system permease subunit [Mycolicibacterium iranicum]|uniref:ABC-type Mn2+/Zn2+ transport system permease subunit n=1 Tax=Mycolicibacterium iranicum TaxID=912594 RepID=A0A839QB66_MYCIR|nr:zinc ABC transporter permease AztB [Mycolicibacterium iranicum]MBB2992064.1 ABC-type Mn2+/Zn2+ transport system permease subunit [Mycolicibacterium iranicum]